MPLTSLNEVVERENVLFIHGTLIADSPIDYRPIFPIFIDIAGPRERLSGVPPNRSKFEIALSHAKVWAAAAVGLLIFGALALPARGLIAASS